MRFFFDGAFNAHIDFAAGPLSVGLVEAVDPLPPQGSALVIKAFGLGRTE